MKISVIGAGLIGLTTAYMLKKDGHDVTIIDRNSGPGEECSFSNGAQLSYCHAEPWASYSSLKNAIKWLGKKDAPLLFKPSLDINMWTWLIKFIAQSTKPANLKSTERILKLGLYSRKVLHDIEEDFDFDFSHRKGGKIFIFKNKTYFEKYLEQARLQELFGSQYQVLNPQETLEQEPSLIDIAGEIYGAVRNPLDETADAYEYCVGLSKQLKKMGVKLSYNTEIVNFKKENNKIKALETNDVDIESDLFILCTGAESPILTKDLGIKIPIYPIKGYSITFELGKNEIGARDSITDPQEKTVYSGLNGKMRVAGTAEFTGYNTDITESRIDMLKASTKRTFPSLKNIDSASKWACLRPFIPDGLPILGKTDKYENLVLNTGHGTLGWTQTFASAKIISDIIAKKEPELDLDWYSYNRF